jgi:hypothetical protein
MHPCVRIVRPLCTELVMRFEHLPLMTCEHGRGWSVTSAEDGHLFAMRDLVALPIPSANALRKEFTLSFSCQPEKDGEKANASRFPLPV